MISVSFSGAWFGNYFSCCCGQMYTVREEDVGRTATCSTCLTGVVVPGPSPAEHKLPPRRKKRKSSELKKTQLKKETPDGYEPARSPDKEMHPALVVAVSIMLFINGWSALDDMIVLPMVLWILPGMEEQLTDMTEEESAEMGTVRKELAQVLADMYLELAGWFVIKLAQLGLAASMAGILLWRGYAIYYAIGCTAIMFLVNSIVILEHSSLATVNVFALIAIILMLKKLPPVAWPRLMARDAH